MGQRFSVVLVVGLLLTGLFGWVYRSAGSGHQHTFTVFDGDHIQGVVFSAPQSGSWSWRLTVHAGTGWEHIVGTQKPNTMPWLPHFTKASGYWSVPAVTNANYQLPEREFQITFEGDLSPVGGTGGGEPYIGEWSIEAEAATEYMVLPQEKIRCVGTEVTFSAEDEEGNEVVSNWIVSGGPQSFSTNNSTFITFTPEQPGIYTVVGTSTGTGKSDSAYLTVVTIELEVSGDCEIPTLQGMAASWPHQAHWKPFQYQEPAIPDYLTKGANNVQVRLLPFSAEEMEYSLKRVFPSHTYMIDDTPKPGGVYNYGINDSEWEIEATWGPCEATIHVDNAEAPVQLPFYGSFQPNKLDSYIDHIPILDLVIQVENRIDAGVGAAASATGLPLGMIPSFTLGVEDHLTNVLESFQLTVTRMHEVWLLECCKKAEKDHRRLEFAFGSEWDISGENDLATAIAEKIYAIAIPGSWNSALDYTYAEIPGLWDGINPANFIKNALSQAIAGVVPSDFQANTEINVNLTRQFEFCAKQGYPKSVAEWETLGAANIAAQAFASGSIDSTEALVPAALYEFVADLFGVEDWGWGPVAVLPLHFEADAQWSADSVGPFYGGTPSVYMKNKHVTTGKAGARTGIAIQPPGGGNPVLIGWRVKSWSPLVTDEMQHMGDFATPSWLDQEVEIPVAVKDDSYSPCE